MAEKPRRTGLGANVFFQPPPPVVQPVEPPPVQQPAPVIETTQAQPPQKAKPEKEEKRAKMRTTVNLYTDTLALLDGLKIHARKNRQKATYSDILDEALRDLAKKKSIQT